jgi:CRISPR/Cas system-associated exonuclease Cas4 (RecB family)
MEMGKAAEERLKNNWMQMGILEDYHARFQNPEYKISGEIDCIIRAPEDGQLFGVEIKSFYGYYASKEIEGNRSQAGRPKFSHLLQTLIYAYELRNIVNYFELFYVERGDGGYKSFKISVAPDELEDGTIVYRPYIDNVLVTSFTMTDVYDRYALALHCIEAEQIPDKEFELYYSNDRIEEEHTAGRLSDSKYDDFKHVHKKTGKVTYHESKRPGDWNCAYCKYKSFCYEDLAC